MKAQTLVSTLVAFAVFSVGTVDTVRAQDLTEKEKKKAKEAVERAGSAKMELVLKEFTGTFENVEEQMTALTNDIKTAGIEIAKDATPVVLVYEQPEGKPSYRLAVGLQVAKKVKAEPPLKAESINMQKAAKYTHEGEYKRLDKVYGGIEEQARAKQRKTGFPAILRLLKDPRNTPAEKLETQLLVPLS